MTFSLISIGNLHKLIYFVTNCHDCENVLVIVVNNKKLYHDNNLFKILYFVLKANKSLFLKIKFLHHKLF